MKSPPVVLTIAGFDPSSGAGVTADLKTFAAHGTYGVAAITTLTVQNTQGIEAVHPVAPSLLAAWLQSLAADSPIRAVKIGALATRANAKVVAEFLRAHPEAPSVLDPVLCSSSGAPLLGDDGFEFLRESLLASVSLITPNLAEASALTGLKVESVEGMKAAAVRLRVLGARAVVVTGGHLDKAVDVYLDGSGLDTFAGERMNPGNLHGAGCAFSSAVAANLALDRPLREAVLLAKAYVTESIKNAYATGLGRIPLNHLYRAEERPHAADADAALAESGT